MSFEYIKGVGMVIDIFLRKDHIHGNIGNRIFEVHCIMGETVVYPFSMIGKINESLKMGNAADSVVDF